MNLDQSWQSVLGQLQMEMPRASFDTWVRDTRPLSYESGILTVGVRNAYARDWLKSRLASTISRLLIGIMDAEVTVKFVVPQEDDFEEEQVSETIEGFTAEIVDASRYSEEVQPDRIVLIPGYSLRLLEQGDLTPKEMSLWVGFRQAVYSQWRKGRGTVKNIPHWEVLRFAMMSRASYFRELSGKDSLAGGLVEIIPEPAPITQGSRSRDNANRYRVHMAPRLTRRDCAVLEMILTAEVSLAATREEGQKVLKEALVDLTVRDPVEYLDQDVSVGRAWPRSILDIIRRVLGIEDAMPEELADAAERLFDRIVRAYGQVLITHYFLREVVPVLGLTHPQVWAIIMLRDRCWYDYVSNTQLGFALVQGGLDTLAKWVGVTRKAVDGWLTKLEFSAFVHKADSDKLIALPEEWRANGTDVFLISHHEPLLSEALEGIEFSTEEKKRDSISEKVRLIPGKSETLYRKNRDSILEKMRLDLGNSENCLNNLIKPLLNINRTSKILTNRPSSQRYEKIHVEKTGGRENLLSSPVSDWYLEKLFETLDVNRSTRDRYLSSRAPAWALVSWLLRGLTLKGVNDPVGFALARVMSRETRYLAGDDFELLAKNPDKLLREIKRILHPYKGVGPSDNFSEIYKDSIGTNQSVATTLWRLLTGEDDCEGVKVTSKKVFRKFEAENDLA